MLLSKCYVLYLDLKIYYKLLCLFASGFVVLGLRGIKWYKGARDNSRTKGLHGRPFEVTLRKAC